MKAQKKPVCPLCGTAMTRLYIHTQDDQKRRHWDGVGWMCCSPVCMHVLRD